MVPRIGKSLKTRNLYKPKPQREPGIRRTRTALLVAILIGCICTGAAALAAWTRNTSLFQLDAIDVGGNHYLTSQRALEMVPVEKGANIFTVDLEAIERSLKQDPRIHDVAIRRQLPSTIVITINERKTVLLLNGDELLGLDEEGMVMPVDGEEAPMDIPVLTGIIPAIGSGDGSHHLGIQKGLEIRRAVLQEAPALWDEISEINVAQPEAPQFYLIHNGTRVQLGPCDINTQIRRLWFVLSDLAARKMAVSSLDMRFKDQLVCRPAGSG